MAWAHMLSFVGILNLLNYHLTMGSTALGTHAYKFHGLYTLHQDVATALLNNATNYSYIKSRARCGALCAPLLMNHNIGGFLYNSNSMMCRCFYDVLFQADITSDTETKLYLISDPVMQTGWFKCTLPILENI